MTVTYAISDIHGEFDLFSQALNWIKYDAGDQPITMMLLGDYVDRGPNSRGVIDMVRRLVNGEIPGVTAIALQGNHEDMMTRAVLDDSEQWTYNWLVNGGARVLLEYETGARELDRDALEADAAFLRSLPMFYEDEHRIYVHAGLRAGLNLTGQHPMDLMWMRPREFNEQLAAYDFGKVIVHGHTPFDKGIPGKRICIDGGACFPGGHLKVAKFYPGQVKPIIERFERKEDIVA